jgi:hypothetical protein
VITQALAMVSESALIEGEKKYSPPTGWMNGWILNDFCGFDGSRPVTARAWLVLPIFCPIMGSRPGCLTLFAGGKLDRVSAYEGRLAEEEDERRIVSPVHLQKAEALADVGLVGH